MYSLIWNSSRGVSHTAGDYKCMVMLVSSASPGRVLWFFIQHQYGNPHGRCPRLGQGSTPRINYIYLPSYGGGPCVGPCVLEGANSPNMASEGESHCSGEGAYPPTWPRKGPCPTGVEHGPIYTGGHIRNRTVLERGPASPKMASEGGICGMGQVTQTAASGIALFRERPRNGAGGPRERDRSRRRRRRARTTSTTNTASTIRAIGSTRGTSHATTTTTTTTIATPTTSATTL